MLEGSAESRVRPAPHPPPRWAWGRGGYSGVGKGVVALVQ